MSDAFFSGLDVAGADDDPYSVPVGTWEATITNVKVAKSAKGNPGIWVDFGTEDKKTISRWYGLPANSADELTEDDRRNLSFLKRFYKQLEIPESQMNNVGPNDLIGLDVTIVVKQKGEYRNITDITRKRGTSFGGNSEAVAAGSYDVDLNDLLG